METDKLRKELQWLLDDVCIHLGFCNIPYSAIDSILERPVFTQDDFVQLCAHYEGFNSDLSRGLEDSLKGTFRKRFGLAIEQQDEGWSKST
jgi:hypothetical protein